MDRRSRDLERRARAGDPDAEAALLQARVRAGELSESQLLLAAYLGHEPAIRATNRRPPVDDRRWHHGLIAFGPDLHERVLTQVFRAELDQLMERREDPMGEHVRRQVERRLLPEALGSEPLRLPPATLVARAFIDPRVEARALRRAVVRGTLGEDRLRLAAYLGDPAAHVALGARAPRVPQAHRAWLNGLLRLAPDALDGRSVDAAIAEARARGLTQAQLREAVAARLLPRALPQARGDGRAGPTGWQGTIRATHLRRARDLQAKAEVADREVARLLDDLFAKDALEELDRREADTWLALLEQRHLEALARQTGLSEYALERLRIAEQFDYRRTLTRLEERARKRAPTRAGAGRGRRAVRRRGG